jgi:hypothetical protein
LITLIVLGALGGVTAGAILYLRTEGGLTGLLTKMAEVIENSRELLPPWMPTIGIEGGRIDCRPSPPGSQ